MATWVMYRYGICDDDMFNIVVYIYIYMRLCRIDMSWYLRWKGQWRCHRSSTRKSLWKFQRLKSRSLEKRVWHDATQCDTSFYLSWDVFTRPRCLQVSIWHPCIVPCIVMYPCVVMRVSQSFTVSLAESLWALDACDDCWGAHPPGGLLHVVPGFWSISRLPHCFGNRWLENASRCCTYDFYVFLKSWSSQVPVPVIQYIVQNSDFTSHYASLFRGNEIYWYSFFCRYGYSGKKSWYTCGNITCGCFQDKPVPKRSLRAVEKVVPCPQVLHEEHSAGNFRFLFRLECDMGTCISRYMHHTYYLLLYIRGWIYNIYIFFKWCCMKKMSKQRTERICLVNLDDIYDVSLSLIGVTLTGKDRGGASGHGRWGCCPSAEGAPSKLESILRSKTSQKNNSRKVYIREFKTAQDMIFASKQVSFVVLLKYWIFNVPFCRTFVHFLRCNMPKSPRNFPKSSWSHGRWSLCSKDREKISYKDEETFYKLCTADSIPVKVLWFARYG